MEQPEESVGHRRHNLTEASDLGQRVRTADGKLVVPTPAGLQLFELLKGAAPALVDPGMTAPIATWRGRGRARTRRSAGKAATDTFGSTRPKAKSLRSRKAKAATSARRAPARSSAAPSSPPTARMVAFAEKLAKEKNGYARDFRSAAASSMTTLDAEPR